MVTPKSPQPLDMITEFSIGWAGAQVDQLNRAVAMCDPIKSYNSAEAADIVQQLFDTGAAEVRVRKEVLVNVSE